ncbi:MAG: nucleoside triphosphate pyrophosphatase [Vulcanibacillus sp.]
MKKIVLASKSPRRKELLESIGLNFTVHSSDAEEVFKNDALPWEVVEQLALMKAESISFHYNDAIIIGADTIVVYEDTILGKPKNEMEAFEMLKKLQGQIHQVFSGLALINTSTGFFLVSHRMTKVHMNPLTDDEIHFYINTKEPLDKAGSYGIQGIGSLFIEKIEGDYYNVVGLPLSLLKELLTSLKVDIVKDLIQ